MNVWHDPEWARRASVYHEAGHALACTATGTVYEAVVMDASGDPERQGHLEGMKAGSQASVVALLAGMAAKLRWAKANNRGEPHDLLWAWVFESGKTDREIAERLTCKALGDETRVHETVQRLLTAATVLVQVKWAAVEAVAEQLEARGRLSAEEVAALAWQHPPKLGVDKGAERV